MQNSDTTTTCDGATVLSVAVDTRRPHFRGALAWWRKVARAIGLHHETTNRGLVRRFVSLDQGRECTEFRRSESERILRAQPYIADATVTTSADSDGTRVMISTEDEVPVVGGARLRGANVEALSVGTVNFLGAGMHVEGRWVDGDVHRDGFGGKVTHHQIGGRPYVLAVEGMRHPVGEFYSGALSHPFLTDLQRIAWHSGYGISKDFARLYRPNRTLVAQPVDRATWDVGGVVRIGPPKRTGLVGGMVLGERAVPRNVYSEVDTIDGRFSPVTDSAGLKTYSIYDATSIAGILGLRALEFSRMSGLDAIVADQDVATGVQIGTLIGTGAPLGFLQRRGFLAVDAYAGSRSQNGFVGARTEAESRFDLRSGDWQHIVVSGRSAWYLKVGRRWTSELSLEGAGVWKPIIPFQIELGERRSGLRGYARSHLAGGQRLLLRLEQRFDVARYQHERAAFGLAGFADAGRVWAGEVPFGVNTDVRASVGAAILAAVPARSQRTIRGELAIPLDRANGARAELRFIVREPARGFLLDPPSIRWARLSAAAEQIFSWP
jgi:hypothetical protein